MYFVSIIEKSFYQLNECIACSATMIGIQIRWTREKKIGLFCKKKSGHWLICTQLHTPHAITKTQIQFYWNELLLSIIGITLTGFCSAMELFAVYVNLFGSVFIAPHSSLQLKKMSNFLQWQKAISIYCYNEKQTDGLFAIFRSFSLSPFATSFWASLKRECVSFHLPVGFQHFTLVADRKIAFNMSAFVLSLFLAHIRYFC